MKTVSLLSFATVLVPVLGYAFPHPPAKNTTLSVSVIHEFPKGTWLQDLAVRPSGSILTTTLTAPTIYQLGSTAPTTPVLLYTFPGVSCALGIAEASYDTFYVTVGNFSFSTFSTVPGSYALYSLKFSYGSDTPTVTLAADLPDFALANGVVSVPQTPYLLLADAGAGIIYRFDTRNAGLSVFLNNTILSHSAIGIEIGVNGLHLAGEYLYFTNTNKEFLARVPLSLSDATVTGAIDIIATGTPMENFAIGSGFGKDASVTVYGAEGAKNDIAKVVVGSNGTGVADVIIGSYNSTIAAGPTALVWGVKEDSDALFFSSTGGIAGYMTGNFEVGGTISKIEGLSR